MQNKDQNELTKQMTSLKNIINENQEEKKTVSDERVVEFSENLFHMQRHFENKFRELKNSSSEEITALKQQINRLSL